MPRVAKVLDNLWKSGKLLVFRSLLRTLQIYLTYFISLIYLI